MKASFDYAVTTCAGNYIAVVEPMYDGQGKINISVLIVPEANNICSGRIFNISGDAWSSEEQEAPNRAIKDFCASILSKLSSWDISEIVVDDVGLGLGFLDCLCNMSPQYPLIRGIRQPLDVRRLG